MNAKSVVVAIVVGACLGLTGQLGCGQRTPSPAAPAADEVRLPEPTLKGQMSVEETLARRRSVRQFDTRELTIAEVGQLAWAAQGITDPATGHRTAPSAGALYPLELYLVKRDGAFRYVPEGHRLVPRSDKDLRGQLSQAALGQSAVREAPLDIVITGVYERTNIKYGDRAERYVQIEAGHVAQNIHLQAVALGLGSVSVGAFRDDEMAKVLSLPTGETPLYIIPVGARR